MFILVFVVSFGPKKKYISSLLRYLTFWFL
jgi:hypothetical protein